MAGSIRFSGTCPTCGRVLFVPVEMLGLQVRCHACGAEFKSSAKSEPSFGASCRQTENENLDSRVDSLLAAADRQLEAACWTSSQPTN